MIAEFDKNRNKKKNIAAEAGKLERQASELDFSAIGKMLCGQELTDKDKKNVEEFNRQHDRVDELN